jgi:hypothetical protein
MEKEAEVKARMDAFTQGMELYLSDAKLDMPTLAKAASEQVGAEIKPENLPGAAVQWLSDELQKTEKTEQAK